LSCRPFCMYHSLTSAVHAASTDRPAAVLSARMARCSCVSSAYWCNKLVIVRHILTKCTTYSHSRHKYCYDPGIDGLFTRYACKNIIDFVRSMKLYDSYVTVKAQYNLNCVERAVKFKPNFGGSGPPCTGQQKPNMFVILWH